MDDFIMPTNFATKHPELDKKLTESEHAFFDAVNALQTAYEQEDFAAALGFMQIVANRRITLEIDLRNAAATQI